MSGQQLEKRPCRPREHVSAASRFYPEAWRLVDHMRAGRGIGHLPAWPDWCFVPMAATYAIVSNEAAEHPLTSPDLIADVSRLGALASWRVTQGIYRFDPDVYEAVLDTPLDRDIPCEVLYHLPEWCVYVETPHLEREGAALYGFFAHLEWDANSQRSELRLLLDAEDALEPIPVHLGAWSLKEGLERARQEAASNMRDLRAGRPIDRARMGTPGALDHVAVGIEPLVSLLLFICSQAAEIGDGQQRPKRPLPKRTKAGWRLFPADKPTGWDVGVRLGSALRRASAQDGGGVGTSHAGPRPHIRRAHWHGFWSGPRMGERTYTLKWLPPIAVNVSDEATLPATVRPVT